MSGNSSSTFDGALYFPTTTLTYSGSSSLNGYNIVVADMITAQRQLDDRQQLQLVNRRLADKRNHTGRMNTNNKMAVAASARGQAMVLICVLLIALMGMIAVVTEFSFMQHQRNMMQTAADSAAMAGSEELAYGDQVAAGKADAATNGYTDGASSVTVAINNLPSTGPNAGNSAYVEATVRSPQPTYFLRVLGVSTMTVSARAVAYEGNGPNCIYVLNPSASGAFSANGNVTVNSGCGLLVDSSSSTGLSVVGNVSITAPTIGVVGGYSAGGSTSLTLMLKTGVIAASDPLAYVPEPTVGSCAHTNFSLTGKMGAAAVRTSFTPAPIVAALQSTEMPYLISTRELTRWPAVG